MTSSIRKENGRSAAIEEGIAEARSGMKANRAGRDRLRTRQLGIGETVLFKLVPAIAERFVPGVREYRAFEAHAQTREELERQAAAEDQKRIREARAERERLFAEVPDSAGYKPEGSIKLEVVGVVRTGTSKRRGKREISRAQTETKSDTKSENSGAPETEVSPFKLVKLEPELPGRSTFTVVEDDELVKRELARFRAELEQKSPNFGTAFDVMVKHLQRTGGMKYLAQNESTSRILLISRLSN